jgi:prepilin-type N-terminal cleavage/methylation domain-containing protein
MKLLRDKRGVTLLELMVVLAIIGVLMGIGIPSYYAMLPHLRVRGASRDVAEALQIARMKAVAMNTTYIVQFNDYKGSPAPANYLALGPRIGTSSTFTHELDSSHYGWTGVDIYRDWQSAPETLSTVNGGDTGTVIFYSDGTASVDGNTILGNQGAIYLLPAATHSECYRVLVDELTGKVTIQYLKGTQWVDS